ncbi:MAG TPA: hypothetical protein VLH79_06930 [Chthonomonadales bacterium]|nr:hypothetical protein [Chthonomonadales bacterium]
MRAKMRIHSVDRTSQGKEGDSYRSIAVRAAAVAKDSCYPADGSDEDNSFARWSPSADLSIHIANPALFDKINSGDVFYVDFHRALPAAAPTG